MSPQLVIFACVLRSIEQGPPPDERCHTPYVQELVTAIQKYARLYNVPAAIEVAKIWHESKFRKRARGASGEIGLGQLLRHGAVSGANLKLTDRQLEVVDTNIRIGMRYLAQFVRECDEPAGWLTKYNRPSRGCRSSRYSRGVLADLEVGRRVRLSESYDTERSGPPDLTTSPQSEVAATSSDRTSCTEPERCSTTPPDTRVRLPAGRRRASTLSESESELAAPFQEP